MEVTKRADKADCPMKDYFLEIETVEFGPFFRKNQSRSGQLYSAGNEQKAFYKLRASADRSKVEVNRKVILPVTMITIQSVFRITGVNHSFCAIAGCDVQPFRELYKFVNINAQPEGVAIVIFHHFADQVIP